MQNLWPLLFLLACPLMMIFMMKGMHGGSGHGAPAEHHRTPTEPDDRDRRIADLEQQVADLGDRATGRTKPDGSPRGR